MNFYNEFDPKAAAWLRELIRQGLIPKGDVDERSITDVRPDDLRGYTQCHFFAGIGGWSEALRLAGWPEDRPVWSGSCPCQPFSCAGKQGGKDDERHLWPVFARLIAECRPVRVFGEQVTGAIGHGWLDGVQADVEAQGYSLGACVLGAHSVGSPHIRQRLYWVADANDQHERPAARYAEGVADASGNSQVDGLADMPGERCGEARECGGRSAQRAGDGCKSGGLGDAEHTRPQGWEQRGGCKPARPLNDKLAAVSTGFNVWSRYDIIPCRDGKARRIEPGLAPLVAGLPRGVVHSCDSGISLPTAEARVMRLKGYGNAINTYTAAEFIQAYQECMK